MSLFQSPSSSLCRFGNEIINQNITDQQPDSLVTVKLVVFSLPPFVAMVTLLGNITGSNFTKWQTERLMGLQMTVYLKSHFDK